MAKKNIIPTNPTQGEYEREVQNNEFAFKQMLKIARPDVYVLMDLLDTTGVNYFVIFQIIRHLNSIALGNKYGSVTAQIENGTVTFVRGEESTKLNEELIVKKRSIL